MTESPSASTYATDASAIETEQQQPGASTTRTGSAAQHPASTGSSGGQQHGTGTIRMGELAAAAREALARRGNIEQATHWLVAYIADNSPDESLLAVRFPADPDPAGGVGALFQSPLITGGTVGTASPEALATELTVRCALVELANRAAWQLLSQPSSTGENTGRKA